ncbi:hypothetical protein DRQ53_15310 [bacterium]|nr:MAG: hypothetical protein DRQ32_05435 [bacterium]RKZ12041.1 MAG: hypothetical protein DRQ53_15310 [bacterium]
MRDPDRSDIMLAIWSAIALADSEDACLGTESGIEALEELFDDLHMDLLQAAGPVADLLDEEFEDLAVATG